MLVNHYSFNSRGQKKKCKGRDRKTLYPDYYSNGEKLFEESDTNTSLGKFQNKSNIHLS